ncbi:S8 family serine peptidase [Algibacter mikhailovii]|uniref:S8 family serine peptidase n=1 Tax=Algibacter mikhailovii TaxID=425498 RepID=UPI002493DEF4|nr:S8 family serine peptidase [Algibacter mikhailovii]
MKWPYCFFTIYILSISVFAQEDAWVYFVDKENIAASIANPISILTQKAIDRKAKHNIGIDSRDVPVNETYIREIKAVAGITVKAKSKWFNAIHIRGERTAIENLLTNSALNFIDYIVYADRSLNLKRHSNYKYETAAHKFKLENSLVNFSYGTTQNQLEMISVNKLHLDDFTGAGVTIAVLDASFTNVNIMRSFERLRDSEKLLGGYDFVDRTDNIYNYSPITFRISHGTQVLSTMAGFIENRYVGSAPDASYYLFRTEDDEDENPVEESYWVEAVERADSLGVDIINTSLGYKSYAPNYPHYSYTSSDMDGKTAFITKGANIAFEKGLLLVTSAGNSGNSGVGAPADSPSVLSIGAVNSSGDYAAFSSVGSVIQPSQKPDVMARGVQPYLIDLNDNIVQNNGTSFSGPIMAGGIACLMQALPNKTNIEIMNLVRESASQYGMPDYQLGYGIPNLYQALETVLAVNAIEKDVLRLYPNPFTSELFLDLGPNLKKATFEMYDLFGKLIFKSGLDNQVSFNFAHLSQGVYLVKIGEKENIKTIKLIKK